MVVTPDGAAVEMPDVEDWRARQAFLADELGEVVRGVIGDGMPVHVDLLRRLVDARLEAKGKTLGTPDVMGSDEFGGGRIMAAILGAILGPERTAELQWDCGWPYLRGDDVDRVVAWYLERE